MSSDVEFQAFMCWIILNEYDDVFAFDIFPPYWNSTGIWNTSHERSQHILVNNIAPDVLVTQETWASAAMILT